MISKLILACCILSAFLLLENSKESQVINDSLKTDSKQLIQTGTKHPTINEKDNSASYYIK